MTSDVPGSSCTHQERHKVLVLKPLRFVRLSFVTLRRKKTVLVFFHMPPTRTAAKILGRIRKRGSGAVWIPTDFSDLGTRSAIDGALHRLCQKAEIRRLAQGLYDRPAKNARFGPVPPEVDVIVAAIARRTGSRVQVAGEGALNRLGLSTQVPAMATYMTDGASRRITVLGRPIILRHATARRLIAAGEVAGTVLEALRALGPAGVDESVIAQLRRTIADTDLTRLERLAASVSETQRRAIARLLGGA